MKDPDIKVAIASGKGGTGKTLVSTNLFYSLKRQGHRVTLVDCDAEEPNDLVFFSADKRSEKDVLQKVPIIDENKCTYCGKCHQYCNYNAIFCVPEVKVISILEDLCHGCGACSVACKDEAISEKDVLLGVVTNYGTGDNSRIVEARMKVGVFSPVAVIKAAIKEGGSGTIMLMDAPPGTSCPFIHTVSPADYVILVTEPTPFGLSDLKQSVETLKTMNKACGVIINRAGLGDRGIYEFLEQENIPLLLEIPFNKNIAYCYSKGELFAQQEKKWEGELIRMIYPVIEEYGNSNYQR